MAVEIPMPRLSQTTDEVKLIRWLVKPGDAVAKGQALCEVENDKTTMEVESFAAGTVLRLAGEPDSVIGAGTVIAVLGEPGETVAAEAGAPPPAREASAGPATAPAAPRPSPAPSFAIAPAAPEGVLATPLVRNLARKHGVDLARVRGTGARGLITRADLEAHLRAPPQAPASTSGFTPAAATATPAGAAAAAGPGGPALAAAAGELPLSPHQRAVARAVTLSKTQVPHYYLKVRIGADRLQAWREANRRTDGRKAAVDAILAWASARALSRHPRLNGTFRQDRLVLQPQVNVGVAVAAGEELHVPVINQAQAKDIRQIDRELGRLADRARAGELKAEDIAGGTVTITNLGMYPVEEFAAVLNAPQLCILAAGRIGREIAVAEDGSFRARAAFTLTGSFDHRAVNGAQGAAFLAEVKRVLEEEL
jgi:pyruvate dehydrogenase E2 component (dihydrolipoamide acetyltransferase)